MSESAVSEALLENGIANLCIENGLTVSTAESCTGGLVAGTLINAAGISAVYKEGFVTYSNEAKEKRLGVKTETLEQFGAVSEETAKEMAVGCAKYAQTDFSVVTTGIAGPGGGTEEKPVGLVYIGCFAKGKVVVERHIYEGDRGQIRSQAVNDALKLLFDMILITI